MNICQQRAVVTAPLFDLGVWRSLQDPATALLAVGASNDAV